MKILRDPEVQAALNANAACSTQIRKRLEEIRKKEDSKKPSNLTLSLFDSNEVSEEMSRRQWAKSPRTSPDPSRRRASQRAKEKKLSRGKVPRNLKQPHERIAHNRPTTAPTSRKNSTSMDYLEWAAGRRHDTTAAASKDRGGSASMDFSHGEVLSGWEGD